MQEGSQHAYTEAVVQRDRPLFNQVCKIERVLSVVIRYAQADFRMKVWARSHQHSLYARGVGSGFCGGQRGVAHQTLGALGRTLVRHHDSTNHPDIEYIVPTNVTPSQNPESNISKVYPKPQP